jgi:hypothetical protein
MYLFISLLYVFQATQCSSSGGSILSIQHLVYITGIYHWYISLWYAGPPVRHTGPAYQTYIRCCIDTIDPPDDEHWVA